MSRRATRAPLVSAQREKIRRRAKSKDPYSRARPWKDERDRGLEQAGTGSAGGTTTDGARIDLGVGLGSQMAMRVGFGRLSFGPLENPLFVGLTPGFVGLFQINVMVPPQAATN